MATPRREFSFGNSQHGALGAGHTDLMGDRPKQYGTRTTARRPHQCWACDSWIAPGDDYLSVPGRRQWPNYYCLDCANEGVFGAGSDEEQPELVELLEQGHFEVPE